MNLTLLYITSMNLTLLYITSMNLTLLYITSMNLTLLYITWMNLTVLYMNSMDWIMVWRAIANFCCDYMNDMHISLKIDAGTPSSCHDTHQMLSWRCGIAAPRSLHRNLPEQTPAP